jgi:hypothetical protein
MPLAGEDHRKPRRVGRRDDLAVAHRAAGLDDRRRARLGRRQKPVGEGKERVRGDDRALASAARARPSASAMSRALRAAMRVESTRLIWPAPMPTVAPSFA